MAHRARNLVMAAAAALVPASVLVPALAGSAPAGAASSSQCNVSALAKTKSPVQITFWNSMLDENSTELTNLTNAFNASQDHVHVNLVNQASYADTWTKVQAALTTGQLADVTQLEDLNAQGAADSKAFVPVQTCIQANRYSTSDFSSRILAYWKVKGVQIGMPFNVSAPLVFYNTPAFTKAGLDPSDPPQTLTQYVADAKKLKASGSGTGYLMDPFLEQSWLATANQLFVNQSNGRKGRATRAVFDTSAGKLIYSELSDLVRSGAAVTNPEYGPDEFDNYLGIGSGKYGMTIGYSSALGTVEGLLKAGKYPNVKLGVGAFPALEAPETGGISPGGAGLYISAKDSSLKKAAAWDYIAFLDSTGSQAEWAANTGYIPIRASSTKTSTIKNLWVANPGFKIGYNELTEGPVNAATAGAALGPFSQVDQDMITGLESMFEKGTAPGKALSSTVSEVNQTISQYNSSL